MKYFLLVIIAFLSACSSSYTPGEKMLEIKKSMTGVKAKEILQEAIWGGTDIKGICGSRGFWYDSESKMIVHVDKISMLAHKRGKQINKIDQGFDGVVVFEKQYYNYDFLFGSVNSINIYDDPLLLPTFPECNRNNLYTDYSIIDLYTDKISNIKLVVRKEEFDRVMAAMSFLMQDIPIYIK